MSLRIPKVTQKGGDFVVIIAQVAVPRVTENTSLEGLLPGVFPALSITLYGFMFSQLC